MDANSDDSNVLVPLSTWLQSVRNAIAKASAVGDIATLALKRVRVQNEEEQDTVLKIKDGLLSDIRRATQETDPALSAQIVEMTKEVKGWRHQMDSYLMQDFIEAKDAEEFAEKYIFGKMNPPDFDNSFIAKGPPSQETLNSFLESIERLSGQGAKEKASAFVRDAIYKKIHSVMAEINASQDIFGKYVASKKLDFLRDFMEKWGRGDGSRVSFFSEADLADIQAEIDKLAPIFEISDKTGNMGTIEISEKTRNLLK